MHDLEGMAAAVTERTRVIWVCNPNNPTGTMVSGKELEAFLKRLPEHVLVVVDEAYFEYVDAPSYPDSLSLLKKDPRLLVLRTFSKIYGLAAFRIGYGVTSEAIVGELNKVREPFNTNRIAQRAARALSPIRNSSVAVSRSTGREKSKYEHSWIFGACPLFPPRKIFC